MNYSNRLFVLFISLIVLSCSDKSGSSYTDSAGNFKISFKKEPVISNESISFPFGNFNWKKASIQLPNNMSLSYSAGYVDLPAKIITSDSLRLLQELFGMTQNDYVQRFGNQAFSGMYYRTIQKYPGREFVWFDKANNIGYSRRVYLVKNRLYMLEVSYTSENQHSKDMLRFFESFRLLKITPNPNPEEELKAPEKNFTLNFPGPAVKKETQVQGALGPQIIVTEMYQTAEPGIDEYHNIAYGVNYSHFTADQLKSFTNETKKEWILQTYRQSALISNGGKILTEKQTLVDGHWCHNGTAIVMDGKMFLQTQTFFIGTYMYQTMVLTEIGYENNRAATDFMNSFKLNH
jgi:hypothetical protein